MIVTIIGLGLYNLAKRLDALKGVYGVKSRPDGSVFWLALMLLWNRIYLY